MPPRHHFQPTYLLTASFIRAPAGLVRRVFAGKRFSQWLDRQSEQFLQNSDWPEFEGPTTAFINCVYISLKPVDVILCPQLLRHFRGLQNFGNTSSNCDATLTKIRSPLPGHCMPLYFVMLDELRLLIPSPGVRERGNLFFPLITFS